MTAEQDWSTRSRAKTVERVVARGKHSLVVLQLSEVWAFEARDRLYFVHSSRGCFDVDLSLTEIEASLGRGLLRVHRCWLVNLANVLELTSHGGGHYLVVGPRALGGQQGALRVPVSRELTTPVKQLLLAGSIGMRPPRRLRQAARRTARNSSTSTRISSASASHRNPTSKVH